EPQELVEAKVDALLSVVIGRRRDDPEAQHVDAAEEELELRRAPLGDAAALELGEPLVERVAVERAPDDTAETRQLAAHRGGAPGGPLQKGERALAQARCRRRGGHHDSMVTQLSARFLSASRLRFCQW